MVLSEDQMVDYLTQEPIKASGRNITVQKVLRHVSLTYGIPVTRLATGWRQKDSKGNFKVDIAVFDSSDQERDLIGLVLCAKAPVLNDRSVITYSEKVKTSEQKLGKLVTIAKNIGSVRYLMYSDSVDIDCMELGEDGTFHDVSFWSIDNPYVDQIESYDVATSLQFSASLRRCHNYLHGNEGLSKDVAFWQILSLIHCKSFDEQSPPSERNFYVSPNEMGTKSKQKEVIKRINGLFNDLKKEKHSANLAKIELSPNAILTLVKEISRFELSSIPGDIGGIAFQELIGSSLRGDKGQYFTPRLAVDLMVEIIKPSPSEIVLDPACGTGGFLLSVLNYSKKNYSEEGGDITLVGADFDPMMSRAAETGLQMSKSQSHHIYTGNSLSPPNNEGGNSLWTDFPLGSVNVILTNPPFGNDIPITDPEILAQFQLASKGGYDTSNNSEELVKSQSPEILFLERCHQWLIPGGRMGIVLPAGLMSNPGDEHIRRFILDNFSVLGCVELPIEAFQVEANVNIITCLLFLQKNQSTQNDVYSAFMAAANKIGFNRRGKPIFRKNPDGTFALEKRLCKQQYITEKGVLELKYYAMCKVIDDDIPLILDAILEK